MSVEIYGTVDKKTANILFRNMHFPEYEFNPETGYVFMSLDCYDKSEYSINDILDKASACLAKAGSMNALIGKEVDEMFTDYYTITKNGTECIDLEMCIEKTRKDKEDDLVAEANATQGMAPA